MTSSHSPMAAATAAVEKGGPDRHGAPGGAGSLSPGASRGSFHSESGRERGREVACYLLPCRLPWLHA